MMVCALIVVLFQFFVRVGLVFHVASVCVLAGGIEAQRSNHNARKAKAHWDKNDDKEIAGAITALELPELGRRQILEPIFAAVRIVRTHTIVET